MRVGDTVNYRDADDNEKVGELEAVQRYISNGRHRIQYCILPANYDGKGNIWYSEDEVWELDDPGLSPIPGDRDPWIDRRNNDR